MSYIATIRIHALPRLPNGWHGHWAVVAKERKQWHKWVGESLAFNIPAIPIEKCKVVCTRFSSVEPDYDNLTASFKPVIDGLKVNKVIKDDKSSCIVDRLYRWQKSQQRKGYIEVYIEELK